MSKREVDSLCDDMVLDAIRRAGGVKFTVYWHDIRWDPMINAILGEFDRFEIEGRLFYSLERLVERGMIKRADRLGTNCYGHVTHTDCYRS